MPKKFHRWCLTTPHLPRSLVAFAVSLATLTLLDSGAQVVVAHLKRTAPTLFAWAGTFDTSFAPEVWLSVIGLTLGTLIIVISIAAQNIPKITELYMQDWISLIYVWSLVLGGAHIFYIKVLQDLGRQPVGSILLNLYGLLPLAILTVLPYIFYILQSIQPESVVQQIYRHQSRYMSQLAVILKEGSPQQPQFLRRCQAHLIAGLNQLDDLLTYVAFPGMQAEIITAVSELLQHYISCKPHYPAYFFRLSGAVMADIAFKTMFDQFSQIEEKHTFYEQKCFRLLGNAYVRFLEEGQFPLASLCGSEMCAIAQRILSRGDDILLDLIIIRFNTMMRFAIKHGSRHNEARNLYNLAFHYRRFIESLVHYQQTHFTQKCVNYLRAYGNEVYTLAESSPALYFIVDVFAAELKKVLILVNEQRWQEPLQRELLEQMLRLDHPQELKQAERDDRPYGKRTGVRLVQMGLALFYLARQQPQFAQRIVEDMVEDAAVLGLSGFKRLFRQNCDRLRQAEPRFWEDTDRGNANLYYSEHTAYLGDLEALVDRACQLLEIAQES